MAQSQQDELASTTLGHASNAVMSTMSLATKSTEPMARSVAEYNMEMAGLLKLRAHALMDASSRMAQCKTPAEFAHLNVKYWQAATQDYLDATRKITTVFSSSRNAPADPSAPPAGNPFLDNPIMQAWTTIWEKGLKPLDSQRSRDYLAGSDKGGLEKSPTTLPSNGPSNGGPSSNGRHAA
jgi:Phasin protein